jgi:prephenate dehydrogenase
MKLAVVGLGLIGGSMALDLKDKGFVTKVIGVDQNQKHTQEALQLGIADEIKTLEEACIDCDLIILSTPVNSLSLILPKVLDLISSHATVIDVGSTKSKIGHAVLTHPKRHQFVSTHPMAGTEFSGPKAAHLGLFKNKATVICDAKFSGDEHLQKVINMYHNLEMRVLSMNSDQHDLHAAYVSHLSHISSFVLANTVLDKEKNVNAIFDLASAGFESTVRLAKSSPDMWAPIFEQNHEHIVEALGAYIDHLKIFQERLLAKDYDGTKVLMTQSNEIKRVLEKIQNKGKSHA